MRLFMRFVAAIVAVSLGTTSTSLLAQSARTAKVPQAAQGAQASQAKPNSPQEEVEPKFIWGVLLNIILPRVGLALLDWAIGRLTSKLDDVSFTSLLKKSEAVGVEPLPAVAMPDGQPLGFKENVVAGEPSKEFKFENGKENFQGMIVSIAVFDAQGKPIGFRPITEPFKTGEKFKLRVLSTFEGHMYIDAINPNGNRSKLFPAAANTLRIPAGTEVLVPAAENQFFQFHGTTGKEKLVIVMRDVKLQSSNVPIEPVYRKDEPFGSLFVQEVSGDKRPLIVQSIALTHQAQ